MSCFDNIKEFRESKRYLKKDATTGVRNMYSNLWSEYINKYGIATSFYRHGYKVETQDDFIYGEDPTEPYHKPEELIMIVDYQTDALLLSKFGLENISDLNTVVSIEDFQNTFGIGAEPKPGDVIELTEAGWHVKEMPIYEHTFSEFNIIAHLHKLQVEAISASPVVDTVLAPLRSSVSETELSFVVHMSSTDAEISGYPIDNILLPIPDNQPSDLHVKLLIYDPLTPEEPRIVYSPLSVPTIHVAMPGGNTLYLNYDIVNLHGSSLSGAGYVPFEYLSGNLLLPIFESVSGAPLTAEEVIIPAEDLDHLELNAKYLMCKNALTKAEEGTPSQIVDSILVELSGIYGAEYIRYPQLFEITEVKYQDFSQPGVNFAQGHYVWTIHAKRFDYSFEPGIHSEGPLEKVYDNSFFGTLSTFGNEPTPPKTYEEDVEDSGEEIWDYNKKGTNTGPYGYY